MTAPNSCEPCGCIGANIRNDYFKQAVLTLLCSISGDVALDTVPSSCDPCGCIGANINNQYFKQAVLVLLCSLAS